MLPLKGLKVLDFSQNGDGPVCALMLAEAGAGVIKIEPPQGEPFRRGTTAITFYNINRNKRSLTCNFKTPEGIAVLNRLVDRADVVLGWDASRLVHAHAGNLVLLFLRAVRPDAAGHHAPVP